MTWMPTIELFFEFASTYSHLTAQRIEALASRCELTIRYTPFLLGPIFKESGLSDSPFNVFPKKGAYMWRDLERRGARHGVPIARPSVFPRNGLLAARVACALEGDPNLPRFIRAVYEANFVSDREIADPNVIEEILRALGLPVSLLEAAHTDEVKHQLRRNTERAMALGIFGAPTLVVGEEIFWGDDRVEDAFEAARASSKSERGSDWDADLYREAAAYVPDHADVIFEWLAPRPGERILDLGCGDGALTKRIAMTGANVIGVDASSSMIETARARGLDAQIVDGQALSFEQEFDAVFSNAALHWMTQPDLVIEGVSRALRPGGRFVGEFGGHGNVAALRVALRAALNERGHDIDDRHTWYFPTAEEYRDRLEAHGFTVEKIELVGRPTPLSHGLASWFALFADQLLSVIEPAERSEVIDRAIALLAPVLVDDRGSATADYVRIRFVTYLA